MDKLILKSDFYYAQITELILDLSAVKCRETLQLYTEFPGKLGVTSIGQICFEKQFGMLYLVNMQMSFLSPPSGYALFYLRGFAPRKFLGRICSRAALAGES